MDIKRIYEVSSYQWSPNIQPKASVDNAFFYPTCSSCERMLVRGDWGEMLCPPTVLQQNKCYEVCWIFRCVANYWPIGSPWHTEDNVGECVSQVNRWVSEPASQSGKKCACNRNTNVYSLNTGCFRAVTISIIFATYLTYLWSVTGQILVTFRIFLLRPLSVNSSKSKMGQFTIFALIKRIKNMTDQITCQRPGNRKSTWLW